LSEYNLLTSPIYLEYLRMGAGIGLLRVGKPVVWAAGLGGAVHAIELRL